MTINPTHTSNYQASKSVISTRNPTQSAIQTVRRQIVFPSWGLFIGIALIFLLPIQIPLYIQLIPLLLSVVLFGLPHGAADMAVPQLLLRRVVGRRQVARWTTGYVLAFMAVLGVWWLAPSAGFVFFILLTWWHWGTADLYAVLTFHEATFLNGRFLRLLTALVRGAIPMLVPLIFFPEVYQQAAGSISGIFGANAIAELSLIFTGPFRTGVAILFVLMAATLFVLSYRQAQRAQQGRVWLSVTVETMLLTLFFALVPSFAAIGLYFCLWHSVQHIVRIALLDDPSVSSIAQGRLHIAFGRFARQAALPTLIAFLALIPLYVLVPFTPDDPLSLVALYLALIAALTFPHAILVAWMDRRQQTWLAKS